MGPKSDTENLIRAAREGSPDALNELLGLYRAQVRYEAGIRLEGALRAKMDGSDAAQNVLLRATERFEQFRGESAAEFAAWLRQILVNHLRDERRRFHGETRAVEREVRIEDVDWFDEECRSLLASAARDTIDEASRRELCLRVADALEQLPDSARETIALRTFHHLAWSEVATQLGISADAARMRWSRGLQQIGFRVRGVGN